MNENILKTALSQIEKDNINELNSHQKRHHFSLKFEKRALAICQSTLETPTYRRHIPLWAAILAIFLAVVMLAGCAFAIYYHVYRYVPQYGLSDFSEDITMKSTVESLKFDGFETETVLYIQNKDEIKLFLVALCDTEFSIGKPVCSVVIGENNIPLSCISSQRSDGKQLICAEATTNIIGIPTSLLFEQEEKALYFEDISENGYGVSSWAKIEDITLKILPLYTNNRLFVIETESNDWGLSALTGFTAIDVDGNRAKANAISRNGNFYTAVLSEKLPKDIAKIEIDSLRLFDSLEHRSISIPILEGNGIFPLTETLSETEYYKEYAISMERIGNILKLTTEIDFSFSQPVDFYVNYESNLQLMEYHFARLENGNYGYIYTFQITENTNMLSLIPTHYEYLIGDGNVPLDTLILQKQ